MTKNPDAIDEGYSIKEPSDLKQFVRKDQNSLKYHCTLCTTFSQKSITNTRNHVEADHFPNMFTYHCDQCDEKLSNKNNYASHNASTHNLQLTDKSDDDNLTCDLCGHLSASRFALYTHRGNTHQLNEFSCDECDLETTLSKLKKHKREVHKGLRSHQCSYCEHVSDSSSHLKAHIEARHESVCYPCNQCGKTLKASYALKMHIETEHNGLLLKCPHCYYVAKQKGHYKHHIKTMHLGQFPTCLDCGLEFNHATGVKEHKEKGHCTGLIDPEVNKICVKCNDCSFVTVSQNNLKSHTETMHLGLPYRCDMCDYEHMYAHELKEHKNSEHPKNGRMLEDMSTLRKRRRENKISDIIKIKTQRVNKVKIKVTRNPEVSNAYEQDILEPDDLRKFIRKDKADLKFYCTLCSLSRHKSMYTVRLHVEAIHFPKLFLYHCDQCVETFPSHRHQSNQS